MLKLRLGVACHYHACHDAPDDRGHAPGDRCQAAPILTTEVAVMDFLMEEGDRALYTYDYGDGWLHDVLFEGSYPKEPGKKYPICLAGELAGPPEDCGGIRGYYDCVTVLKNRDNSEGKLIWLGRWRPDRFDPAKIKFWSPLTRLKTALRD